MIERGSGHAIEWEKLEPGRWNLRYLEKVFKRLHGKGLVTRSASYSPFHRRHRFTYHPSVTSKKARAA